MKRLLVLLTVLVIIAVPLLAERRCAATNWNPSTQCPPPDDPCTSLETICAPLPYAPSNCEWCTAWVLNTCTDTREEETSWMSCPF